VFTKILSTEEFDPDLHAAVSNEASRQEEHIELIASENYASPRVMEMQGSVLTNKDTNFTFLFWAILFSTCYNVIFIKRHYFTSESMSL